MKYDGCENNVDIQVLDCPLFHTTTFVTTQDDALSTMETMEVDSFHDLFTSTTDILITTYLPDSIEAEESFSSRNHIILLSTMAGCFIIAVWII